MSVIEEERKITLKVIKRDGKKVDFNGTKIAMAIKKAFDKIDKADDGEENGSTGYTEKDINTIYKAVITKIEKEYQDAEKIKIETIQDMIEDLTSEFLNSYKEGDSRKDVLKYGNYYF